MTVADALGKEDASETGPQSIPQIERALIQGRGQIGRAFGLVDDARLQWRSRPELDPAPDKNHYDRGHYLPLEKRHGQEDENQQPEPRQQGWHLIPVGESST